MSGLKIRVFVTKYALTKTGVFEKIVYVHDDIPTMVTDVSNPLAHYHKPDWHETELAARQRVIEMINKKLLSIEKQVDFLKRKRSDIQTGFKLQ